MTSRGPGIRRGFDSGVPSWNMWPPPLRLDEIAGDGRCESAADLERYMRDRLDTGRPIRVEVVA